MARIDVSIPSLSNKFIDLRDTIPGDSFNWSWVRSLNQVNYLAIHHTAGPDSQTPAQIANFHINSNGWGGIGYHFLIDKSGIVYYVGDISTARANVANLNDQVIGICLIGNFTEGRVPTSEQFDSVNKLCDFFINNYPALVNVNSWDAVRGHKDLPGQSTTCPGDNWPNWRPKIVSGVSVPAPTPIPPAPSPALSGDRGAKITDAYRQVLGRDPDAGGLQTYTNGPLTMEQIIWSMVTSEEHKNLLKAAEDANSLRDQISNMQTSLTSINQQVLILQESLKAKDQEINNLRSNGLTATTTPREPSVVLPKVDNTLTLTDLAVNLFKFIFWPRSAGS